VAFKPGLDGQLIKIVPGMTYTVLSGTLSLYTTTTASPLVTGSIMNLGDLAIFFRFVVHCIFGSRLVI